MPYQTGDSLRRKDKNRKIVFIHWIYREPLLAQINGDALYIIITKLFPEPLVEVVQKDPHVGPYELYIVLGNDGVLVHRLPFPVQENGPLRPFDPVDNPFKYCFEQIGRASC